MKKLVGVLLAAVAFSLTATSCMVGNSGNVYGDYDYDGSPTYLSLGGFPSGTIYSNHNYEISPGTYAVYYQLYYDGSYWPSYDYSFYSTYSVSANAGTFLKNGDDKYFDLYLSINGLDEDGDNTAFYFSEAPSLRTPKLGTFSWSKNGLTVTVTNSIVQLTADQIAKLKMNTVGKR